MEIVLACIDEFESGKMSMMDLCLNFRRVMLVLQRNRDKEGYSAEFKTLFSSRQLKRWLERYEGEFVKFRTQVDEMFPEGT